MNSQDMLALIKRQRQQSRASFWDRQYMSGSEESINWSPYVLKSTKAQLSENSVDANSSVTIAVTGSSHPTTTSLSNVHFETVQKTLAWRSDQ